MLEVKNMTTYFERVEINKETYQIGDFAEVIPEDSNSKPYICKIIALFQIKQRSSVIKAAHVRWFARGENTIFGDIAGNKLKYFYRISVRTEVRGDFNINGIRYF